MPNRSFGHIEMITSSTIIISVEENGIKRREEIARANPHIDDNAFKIGDPITFWTPRIQVGHKKFISQQENDYNALQRLVHKGYVGTNKTCVYCCAPTAIKHGQEICVRCQQTQIRG